MIFHILKDGENKHIGINLRVLIELGDNIPTGYYFKIDV